MEFKPLIDYAKAPVPNRRRSIEFNAGSFFQALVVWVAVFVLGTYALHLALNVLGT